MGPPGGTPLALLPLLGLLVACDSVAPPPHLLGGETTVFDVSPNAFSQPAPGLDREQELLFFVGNSFFNQNWVTAPASTTARDGLGPHFNSRSCAGCHLKDGRGRPPASASESGTGFLVRLSVPVPGGSDAPDPSYGGQLQDQAIPGVPAEGRVRIDYGEVRGAFADGTPWSLRSPRVTITDLGYGELSRGLLTSPRLAPQMIGLGLLEAVPEADLLVRADPEDQDGDGISGRPNRLRLAPGEEPVLGRFGWKANQPSLAQQAAGAFLGDMGITTPLFPSEDCTAVQVECLAAESGGDPEIAADDFEKVVLYVSSLAVPAMRDPGDLGVVRGHAAFLEIGCAACHVETLRTGTHRGIPALSNQTIHPYTDLLIHDMGPGLADGRPDGEASGSEWRTPPLWGIGLLGVVNGNGAFLHDGRARDLSEAILWHGGEAEAARDRYLEMPADRRADLLRFLESL